MSSIYLFIYHACVYVKAVHMMRYHNDSAAGDALFWLQTVLETFLLCFVHWENRAKGVGQHSLDLFPKENEGPKTVFH